MSLKSFDRQTTGFPVGSVSGSDWSFLTNFGGMGGGGDNEPLPWRYIYWPIRVNPFSRLNKKLILANNDFIVWTDANHQNKAAFALIISDRPPSNDTVSTSQILSKVDVPANITLPMRFEFDQMSSDKLILPQPTMSTYDRKIYAIIDLLQTGRYAARNEQIIEAMETVSLQYEGTP